MAKKTKTEVEEPQIKEVAVETAPVIDQSRERIKPKNQWEIKDRVYYLKSNKKPLSNMLKLPIFIILTKKKVTKESLSIVKIKKLHL